MLDPAMRVDLPEIKLLVNGRVSARFKRNDANGELHAATGCLDRDLTSRRLLVADRACHGLRIATTKFSLELASIELEEV